MILQIVADSFTSGWVGACRGHQINYSVSGSGKPLILVHGFGRFLLDLPRLLYIEA